MNIPILSKLREAKVDQDACLVEGIILTSGVSENGTYYSPEVVEKSAPVFKDVQCYADHQRSGETERSVRDVVGLIEDAWPDNGQLRATIRLSRAHAWLLTMIGESLVGDLSINALGRTKVSRRDGRIVREVLEISKAHSVDFVARAAAGGRVERILRESAGYREGLRLLERISIAELAEARPDIFNLLKSHVRDELLKESDGGVSEIERRRVGLLREALACRMIDSSGLPVDAKKFILNEALSIGYESEDSYRLQVSNLIERHRKYLAGLASEGIIRGMGSEKREGKGQNDRKSTLHLMGV